MPIAMQHLLLHHIIKNIFNEQLSEVKWLGIVIKMAK